MKKIIVFAKKDIVLSLAMILAIASLFFVHPDQKYLVYIDYRTLVILFCLMTIVAGWKKIGILNGWQKKCYT